MNVYDAIRLRRDVRAEFTGEPVHGRIEVGIGERGIAPFQGGVLGDAAGRGGEDAGEGGHDVLLRTDGGVSEGDGRRRAAGRAR